MKKTTIIKKMIDYYQGNIRDIEHFLKVYQYASLIGAMEGLDEATQDTLEVAAIVHDIACPLCREKYGKASGEYQERESEGLLKPFLEEFHLPDDMRDRIVYLVSHHHTYTDVDGEDYQILLEADFLVNAAEQCMSREAIQNFFDNHVRTEAGKTLFRSIFLC